MNPKSAMRRQRDPEPKLEDPARCRPRSYRCPPALLLLFALSLSTAISPVSPSVASAAPIATRSGLARSGPQPFVTILCKFADVAAEPEAPAFFERLLGPEYPGLDNYWRAVSYGAISLEGSAVTGWHTLPASRDAYFPAGSGGPDLDRLAQDCADAAAAAQAGVEWSRYLGMIFVFNADLARPAGGTTCLALADASHVPSPDAVADDRRCYPAAWIWPNYYHNQALWAHEMGHALGLRHSATGDLDAYDNPWDVMSDSGPCGPDRSFGQVAQEPAAYDKDLLGWIPPARKILVPAGSTVSVTLTQLAEPAAEGYLLVQIPIEGSDTRFYTLEARRQVGYDGHLPGNAVVLHAVDLDQEVTARAVSMGNSPSRVPAGMWMPGSTYRDTRHNIAVSVDKATADGFEVTVRTKPSPWGLSPDSGIPLPAGPVEFAWQPVPGATAYELAIVRTTAGVWPVPRIVRKVEGTARTVNLAPGGYWWEVRALFGEAPDEWTSGGYLTTMLLLPEDARDAGQPDPMQANQAAADGSASAARENARGARDEGPDGAVEARIVPDGKGGAYAIWRANAAATFGSGNSGANIYAAYRPVGGQWGLPEQVNEGPAARRSEPILAVDGQGRAYAAWIDDRTGPTAIYFSIRRQTPAGEGESPWSTNVKVNDNSRAAMHTGLALAVDRLGRATAAWSDNRDGETHIYTAFRPWLGTWTPNMRASKLGSVASSPSLAVDSWGIVYMAWLERRGCSAGRWPAGEVFFAAHLPVSDYGWTTPSKIVVNYTLEHVSAPSIAADDAGNLYAAWQEGTGANAGIYGTSCPQRCLGAMQEGAGYTWGAAVRLGQAPQQGGLIEVNAKMQGKVCARWGDGDGQNACFRGEPAAE